MNFCKVSILLCSLFCFACGYHYVGRARSLPSDARTVLVGNFINHSLRVDAIPFVRQALQEEMDGWPRLTVVSERQQAHLVLEGEILDFQVTPVHMTYSLEKRSFQVRTTLALRLIDRQRNELIAENRRIVFHQVCESKVSDLLFVDDEIRKMARSLAQFALDALLERF